MPDNTASANNSAIKVTMLIIVSLVIIGAIAFFYIRPHVIQKELPAPVVIDTAHQPMLGNPNARVHIVAFEDLKCTNCARFNVEMMPYIKKEFIDTGVAKYTMMNVAFIEGSMPAANAAHCVYAQNHALFFDYTNYLFKHQPPENQDWATVPNLLNYANKIKGINTDQLAQCMIKSPYDNIIHANLSQAMKVMGGNGVATPTVYINGIRVHPLTKTQIKRVIEAVK